MRVRCSFPPVSRSLDKNYDVELVPKISETPWLQGYFFVVLKKLAPAASPVEVPQSSVVFATQEVADQLVRFPEVSRTGSTPPETSLHMSSLIWREVLGQALRPDFPYNREAD